MTQLTNEDRALMDMIIERAEQACRYVVKHCDGSWDDVNAQYREGFETAAELCEGAIRGHIERHIEKDLSAARQARTQGPGEGFVVVPVEPTREMLKAASDYADECARENYGGAPDAEGVWDAMLSAAPPASLIKEG